MSRIGADERISQKTKSTIAMGGGAGGGGEAWRNATTAAQKECECQEKAGRERERESARSQVVVRSYICHRIHCGLANSIIDLSLFAEYINVNWSENERRKRNTTAKINSKWRITCILWWMELKCNFRNSFFGLFFHFASSAGQLFQFHWLSPARLLLLLLLLLVIFKPRFHVHAAGRRNRWMRSPNKGEWAHIEQCFSVLIELSIGRCHWFAEIDIRRSMPLCAHSRKLYYVYADYIWETCPFPAWLGRADLFAHNLDG